MLSLHSFLLLLLHPLLLSFSRRPSDRSLTCAPHPPGLSGQSGSINTAGCNKAATLTANGELFRLYFLWLTPEPLPSTEYLTPHTALPPPLEIPVLVVVFSLMIFWGDSSLASNYITSPTSSSGIAPSLVATSYPSPLLSLTLPTLLSCSALAYPSLTVSLR